MLLGFIGLLPVGFDFNVDSSFKWFEMRGSQLLCFLQIDLNCYGLKLFLFCISLFDISILDKGGNSSNSASFHVFFEYVLLSWVFFHLYGFGIH